MMSCGRVTRGENLKIPFNRPSVVANEHKYVAEVLAGGRWSGDSPFSRKCELLLQEVTTSSKALLTPSCTDALEMAALLLDLEPGDEFIVPSFTFTSTANAFVLRGAKPVFIDIRPDTLNLDEKQLENLITARIKAIVPVHYAGVGCEMDEILQTAERHGISVVEDNAHALFGKYRGRPLGTFGVIATQSFHETKNITCGEGGALLINQKRYVERAEVLREKGTNRARFFRGQVDKYTWVDTGSSFLPSELQAAVLYGQLEAWEQIQQQRRRIWERYWEALTDWAEENGVQMPIVPAHCDQAYHMFYLLLPTPEDRDAFIAHLRAQGILSVFHYLPLHDSPMGRRCAARRTECPVTVDVSSRLVRLPFYYSLSETDQELVVENVRSFRRTRVETTAKAG